MSKPTANAFMGWKQTRAGLLVTGLVELALAYGFGSWAIDSGSWWHYLLTFVFFAGAVQSFVRAAKNHGN
jgi:hypothetical protein